MRVVTFKSVYERVLLLKGLNPKTVTIPVEAQERIADRLTERVRIAWEHDYWPELMRVEERLYRPEWDAAKTYAIGDEVYHNEEYYIALQISLNKDPETETAYWEVKAVEKYVSLDQAGETPIGMPINISKNNPRLDRDTPWFLNPPILSERGIEIDDEAGDSVWIEFRIRSPEFTRTPWDNTKAYAEEDVVYCDTTGECYKALQSSTNKTPNTETTYWEKVDFPWIFSRYAALGAWSDELLEDGNQEKAMAQEGKAMEELDRVSTVELAQQPRTAQFTAYP